MSAIHLPVDTLILGRPCFYGAIIGDFLGNKLGHPIIFPDHNRSSRLPGSFDYLLRNSTESSFYPGRERAVFLDWFNHELTP